MTVRLIWVDQNSDSTDSFRAKLGSYPSIQIFNEAEAAIQYIEAHSNQDSFLITSGVLAKTIVPRIAQYDSIKMIFVFCGNMREYINWAMDYIERILLFDHPDDLLERLWLELENYFRALAQHCIEQADLMKERAKAYKQSCG